MARREQRHQIWLLIHRRCFNDETEARVRFRSFSGNVGYKGMLQIFAFVLGPNKRARDCLKRNEIVIEKLQNNFAFSAQVIAPVRWNQIPCPVGRKERAWLGGMKHGLPEEQAGEHFDFTPSEAVAKLVRFLTLHARALRIYLRFNGSSAPTLPDPFQKFFLLHDNRGKVLDGSFDKKFPEDQNSLESDDGILHDRPLECQLKELQRSNPV
mmetsp:Transcript_850/g.2230  ORF Transcript_850/g.2230 Transcript_850/m.2230 type:complete len:211 (+) Transcript_850:1512-2144(+)